MCYMLIKCFSNYVDKRPWFSTWLMPNISCLLYNFPHIDVILTTLSSLAIWNIAFLSIPVLPMLKSGSKWRNSCLNLLESYTVHAVESWGAGHILTFVVLNVADKITNCYWYHAIIFVPTHKRHRTSLLRGRGTCMWVFYRLKPDRSYFFIMYKLSYCTGMWDFERWKYLGRDKNVLKRPDKVLN